jgi:hypothetical protein
MSQARRITYTSTAADPEFRAPARRAEIVRDAAERIAARNLELAAWMVYEVGKTRLEAMAEVEESADLLRYYAERLAVNHGYRRPLARMSPEETTESVLLPYGVWAVVSPFNFPSALAAGMIAGALLGGNTVVFKPALDAPVSGELLCEALWAAGVPRDALQLVHGSGASVGEALLADERIAGVAFTGSSEVGMRIVRGAREGASGPRPWLRDGRQESRHRHRQGRPRCGRAGRPALGLRSARPEVLGLLAGLRRTLGRPGVSSVCWRVPGRRRAIRLPATRRRAAHPAQCGRELSPLRRR